MYWHRCQRTYPLAVILLSIMEAAFSFKTILVQSQLGISQILCALLQNSNHPVILFDGVCNLCNGVVVFLIKHDKKAVFKFASLQSAAAQQLIGQYEDLKNFDTVVLLQDGQVFQKSTAALKVLKHLPWYWQWAQVFWLVPQSLRDLAYNWIARNRYKWFGKMEACMIPTPGLKNRFLPEP